MRITATVVTASLSILLLACGAGQKEAPPQEQAQAPDTVPGRTLEEAMENMPADEIHKGLGMGGQGMGGMMGGTMNREVHLDDAVSRAWSGIRVRVENLDDGTTSVVTVPLGSATPLDDTGLVLTAEVFVPDFVMDENGITTRSPEPKNPAARVTITEEGQPEFSGWLFASMPDIHPFPHEHYRVTLLEGVPANDS